jgi:hypothetical protein
VESTASFAELENGLWVVHARKSGNPAPFKRLYDAQFRQMGELDEYAPEKRPALLERLVSTVHLARAKAGVFIFIMILFTLTAEAGIPTIATTEMPVLLMSFPAPQLGEGLSSKAMSLLKLLRPQQIGSSLRLSGFFRGNPVDLRTRIHDRHP